MEEKYYEIAKALKAIFLNDKTVYSYSGSLSKNRFGQTTERGSRWQTPAEIAENELRIMGFASPYEVGDRSIPLEKPVIDEKIKDTIHYLRNSYGQSDEERTETRIRAANLIEMFMDAYLNMRNWAENSGLETASKNSAKES